MPYEKTVVTKPTDEEMKAGPVVRLSRTGWVGHSWSPHGFAYSVRFNDKAEAVVLKSHYDEWIADSASTLGITVVKPKAKK